MVQAGQAAGKHRAGSIPARGTVVVAVAWTWAMRRFGYFR
jgi:hypothetical protein